MATETFIIDIRTRGTKRSAADVKRIGTQASQVRKTLAFLRAALVTVAAIRVFGALTRSLVSFSDEMLVVKAVTGATTAEFVRMRDVAKGLGATTRFTAAEAAEGMAFLARAGFEVNEVMTAIPATLDLAAAAQLDLGNAADIASNLMTSFGLSVEDLPDVIDTLVFTANNANTTVQQLADGLKLFAPLASQFGISIEQAASAMGVLGDSGIQASLAGTGLRRIITDLETPTGALKKILLATGVALDKVRPSANDLADIMDTLRDANIGASAASLAFGKRGGFVFAALQRGTEAFRELTKEQEKNTGIAKKNAEELEKGLGGALRLVRSAIQNLLIAFADLGAEETLNQFFRGLAEFLRLVARNAADVTAAVKVMLVAFAVAKVVSFGRSLLTVSANMRLLLGQLKVAPAATLRATFGFRALGAAMLAIPFVAILTAFTAIIGGLVLFRDEIKLATDDGGTMADVFTALGDQLGTEFAGIINALGFDFKDFAEIVKTVASRSASAIEGIIGVFFGLTAVVRGVFQRIEVLFKEFLLGVKITIFAFQEIVNEVATTFGFEKQFDTSEARANVGTLADEVIALNRAITDGGTLAETFVAGFQGFIQTRKDVTSTRITAAQDAAILATEEANRRAAQARANRKEPAAPFLGDTFDDLGGDGGAAKKAAAEIKRLTEALKGLEAAQFPIIAQMDAEAELFKTINDARAKGIDLRVDEEELIRRTIRSQIGANRTIDQAIEEQQLLKTALDDTIISLEEFEFLSRRSAITFLDSQRDAASGAQRAFLKFQQDATDSAAFAEKAMTDAFKNIEDAVVEFANTGKLSVNSFFRNFSEQLLRLGTQQAIAGIGSAFPGLGGGAATGASGGQAGPGGLIAGFLGGLFGAKDGANFTVGGNSALQSLPGLDNRLIAFKARDGEEVTVTPRSGGSGPTAAPVNQIFNIQTKDADSFKRSQSQIQNRALAGINQARRRR